MDISLTLEKLKFANVPAFSRDFGVKKTHNGGSLITEEFNENVALPFDVLRPVVITESSVTGNVEYNANLLISSNDEISLTLGKGTYTGCRVKIKNMSTLNQTVIASQIQFLLKATALISLVWNGSAWENETLMDLSRGTMICNSQASESPVVSGWGLSAYYEGLTIKVRFSNGHYGNDFSFGVDTLPALPVYAVKDGADVLMSSHAIDRNIAGEGIQNWYIQSATTLTLCCVKMNNEYIWEIQDNPIVLSKSSDVEGYTVYADGKILNRQRIEFSHTTFKEEIIFFPVKFKTRPTIIGIAYGRWARRNDVRWTFVPKENDEVSGCYVYGRDDGEGDLSGFFVVSEGY